MKYMYNGQVFESAEGLNEGFFSNAMNKQVKPGYSKKPTLGRSAVFFYVEDAKEPGFIQPDIQNPIVTDYIQFCPNLEFAKKLKAKYMEINKLPEDYPVNVIKRTKEVVG